MKKLLLFLTIFMIAITTVQAFDTLSLSKIDFNSNDPTLKRSAFVLSAVENNAQQYADFALNNENLGGSLPSGYQLTGTGSIKSQISNYKITYPITAAYDFVIPLQICDTDGDCDKFFVANYLAQDWCYNLANNAGATGSKAFYVPQRLQYVCSAMYNDGKYGIINSGTHQLTDTFTVSVAGKPSQTITVTQKDRSAQIQTISGNNIYAKITGALSNFADVPRPDLQRGAYYSPKTGSWTVISNYDDYNSQWNPNFGYSSIQTKLNNCIGDNGNNFQSCMTEVQAFVKNGEKTSIFYDTTVASTSVSGSSETKGEFFVVPTKPFYFPVITLTIDAEWVGIVQPVGKPVITSLTAPEKFVEGSNTFITSKVKNDAGVTAGFDYSWVCTGPFSVETISTVQFGAFETKQISHKVFGETTTGSSSGSCTLKVNDREKPTNFDTKTVNLVVTDANQCDYVGLQRCDGTVGRLQCVEKNGVLVWEAMQSCIEACKLEGTYAVCVEDKNVLPVCGDGTCVASERLGGDYECYEGLQDPFDCYKPIKPPIEINWVIIVVSIISVGLIGGALYLRLKKMGYLK